MNTVGVPVGKRSRSDYDTSSYDRHEVDEEYKHERQRRSRMMYMSHFNLQQVGVLATDMIRVRDIVALHNQRRQSSNPLVVAHANLDDRTHYLYKEVDKRVLAARGIDPSLPASVIFAQLPYDDVTQRRIEVPILLLALDIVMGRVPFFKENNLQPNINSVARILPYVRVATHGNMTRPVLSEGRNIVPAIEYILSTKGAALEFMRRSDNMEQFVSSHMGMPCAA